MSRLSGSELQSCVKRVISNQCGDELADVISNGIDDLTTRLNCPAVEYDYGRKRNKRSGNKIARIYFLASRASLFAARRNDSF